VANRDKEGHCGGSFFLSTDFAPRPKPVRRHKIILGGARDFAFRQHWRALFDNWTTRAGFAAAGFAGDNRPADSGVLNAMGRQSGGVACTVATYSIKNAMKIMCSSCALTRFSCTLRD
jgi:hypothetical protein